MRLAIATLALVVGCGKQLNADYCLAHPDDVLCSAADAQQPSNDTAVIDGTGTVTANRIYVSTTSGQLYGVDVGTMTAQLIGVTKDPNNASSTLVIDGLGFHPDGMLVAVTSDSQLLRIDPATATVTSKVAMAASHSYWGLTVAPPGAVADSAVVFVAANDTQNLYEVRADGTLQDIGSFGNGLAVAGDISWVPGVGLFASVTGNGCSGTCIARLSTTNGQATLLASSGPGDMWALAAFGGELWAIGGSDQAYTVNQTTGVTSGKFSTSIAGVSDAAP